MSSECLCAALVMARILLGESVLCRMAEGFAD